MTQGNTPVVLVVEDDPPVRDLLDDVLREEGYSVVTAHNGNVALQTLASLQVDLVTLDLDLPGLSGSELLEVLRNREIKIPPVIVITGEKPVGRQVKQVAQAVITKPFDIDDLIAAALRLLPGDLPRAEAKLRQRREQRERDEQAPQEDEQPQRSNNGEPG